jgi:hypothetical protein
MDWRDLNCTMCRVRFWSPKYGTIHRRISIAGCYYCERCAKRRRKRMDEIESLNRNCALRQSYPNKEKVVVIPPRRPR